MHFQFRLSFEDYLAALSLHSRRGVVPMLLHIIALYLFPISGLCLLARTVLHPWERFDPWAYLFPAYLIACPVVVLLMWRVKFKRSQIDSGECSLDLGDLILVQSLHSKTELEWSAIKRFREGKKTFLLYLAPGKFIPIPKRICSAQDVTELRALLQNRVSAQEPVTK